MFDAVCPVCDSEMQNRRTSWRYRCPSCGFERSNFVPNVRGETERPVSYDADKHERGHERMRRRIYERILDILATITPLPGKTILDVGCSYGWFPEAARNRGMDALGIEPDYRSAEIAEKAGNKVIAGYFPDDLPDDRRFDVIIFNDVFEHLPDVRTSLALCRARLNPGGLLVLNLPSRKGSLYQTASVLDRIGVSPPLDRLWLKNFPSPHLSYFCPETLARLLTREAFVEAARKRLPIMEHRNLWTRIRVDASASLPYTAAVWLALTVALPLLTLLPSDIALQIFRKSD